MSYKTFTYTVPAGGTIGINRRAGYLICLEADAAFQVQFDNGEISDFEAGLTYDGPGRFNQVRLIETSGSDNTIKVAIGDGSVKDSRQSISTTVATQETNPDTFTASTATSCTNSAVTALAAANTKRVSAVLVNDGAGRVYVSGNAAAAAGEGLPLDPLATMVLDTAAALYARNDAGSAVPVYVAEIERS